MSIAEATPNMSQGETEVVFSLALNFKGTCCTDGMLKTGHVCEDFVPLVNTGIPSFSSVYQKVSLGICA